MLQKYVNNNRWITSGGLGAIIPIFLEPTLPKGIYKINPNISVKFQPFADCAIGSLKLKVKYRYVDMSLIWTDYKKHWLERAQGASTTTAPTIDIAAGELAAIDDTSLHKLLGLPKINNADVISVNALPYRVYAKIWWDEYMKNLASIGGTEESSYYSKGNGTDSTTSTTARCSYYDTTKDYRYNSIATQMDIALPTIANGDDYNDFRTFLLRSRMAEFIKKLTNQSMDLIRKFFQSEKIPAERVVPVLDYERYLNISEIFSTAETATNIVGASATIVNDKMIDEVPTSEFVAPNYGYIMGVATIEPEVSEFRSIVPHFLKNCNDLETLPNPAYANLGYMPILRFETEYQGINANDGLTIAYRPIFEPIRTGYNIVAGDATDDANKYKIIVRDHITSFGNIHEIVKDEYEYLFASNTEPQFKLYVINHVEKMIPMPKTLDYMTIDKIMNTQNEV